MGGQNNKYMIKAYTNNRKKDICTIMKYCTYSTDYDFYFNVGKVKESDGFYREI